MLCLPFAPTLLVVEVSISAGFPFFEESFIFWVELVFFLESLVGDLLDLDSVERAGECPGVCIARGGDDGGRKS